MGRGVSLMESRAALRSLHNVENSSDPLKRQIVSCPTIDIPDAAAPAPLVLKLNTAAAAPFSFSLSGFRWQGCFNAAYMQCGSPVNGAPAFKMKGEPWWCCLSTEGIWRIQLAHSKGSDSGWAHTIGTDSPWSSCDWIEFGDNSTGSSVPVSATSHTASQFAEVRHCLVHRMSPLNLISQEMEKEVTALKPLESPFTFTLSGFSQMQFANATYQQVQVLCLLCPDGEDVCVTGWTASERMGGVQNDRC